ncbi:hypothetical protein BH24CHL4_BH24CHL4_17620 [soil metagenome]
MKFARLNWLLALSHGIANPVLSQGSQLKLTDLCHPCGQHIVNGFP